MEFSFYGEWVNAKLPNKYILQYEDWLEYLSTVDYRGSPNIID